MRSGSAGAELLSLGRKRRTISPGPSPAAGDARPRLPLPRLRPDAGACKNGTGDPMELPLAVDQSTTSAARAQGLNLEFPRDEVVDVPVLARADRGLAVLVELVEQLDLERREQLAELVARVNNDAGPGPVVVVAEELPAEAAAGPQRVDDLLPHARELLRRAEREREARVHEVARRPVGVFEARESRLELRRCGDRSQPLDRLRLAIDREHAPAAPQQLGGVPSGAGAEVDRQPGRVEAPERVEERRTRVVACDREVQAPRAPGCVEHSQPVAVRDLRDVLL